MNRSVLGWFVFSVMLILGSPSNAADGSCYGKFPDLFGGVCWSCAFPIKIFGNTALVSDSQEDYDSRESSSPICYCEGATKVGIPVSFWEPARMVEVTRTPYCFPLLGGVKISTGVNEESYGAVTSDVPAGGIPMAKSSFRHVNYYINPLMYVLDVLLDNSCLEQKGFDMAYMSPIDPTHNDEELAGIMAPYAFPFGGALAQGACAADCIAATTGISRPELFWCSGCNGSVYPLTGFANAHIGMEQVGRLHTHRILAKFHAAGTQWATTGEQGMCSYYPQIIMDKRAYKVTRLYYKPQTQKVNGRCCDPVGRSTILSAVGAEVPMVGEDVGYMIFRKRDCCQGAVGF